MFNFKNTLPIAVALTLSACAGYGTKPSSDTASQNTYPTFSADRIAADVKFLSDDLLRGRDTGSEGHRIAAHYVASEFAKLGLKPAGIDGYLQEVPFATTTLEVDSASMQLNLDDQSLSLTLGDDYYISGSGQDRDLSYGGDLVFVGYGIVAPERNHNDFEGLDIKGKIAVYLSGAPKSFDSETRAHYGSGSTKADVIGSYGAVGSITINTNIDEKRRPFKSYKKYLGRPSFDWLEANGKPTNNHPTHNGGVSMSHDVAAKIWAASGKDLTAMLAEADTTMPKGFALKANVRIAKKSTISKPFNSPNVLAVLEGSDPKLKHEYVVLSAHLDHIGVSKTAKGDDKINNGALDNASGVAVMLEVARKYIEEGVRPRRSLMFAAVTAEERGLLGADYFASHPTVDKKAMVANVNLDMPVLLYDFTDVVAFGASHSSLGPITETAVNKVGIALGADPIPSEAIFVRSDHYPFVKQGVPAVMLATGFGPTTDGLDGGKIFMEFLHKTYHSPKDDILQAIDYNAASKFALINWLIISEIANGDKKPTWNDGDFFGDLYGSDR